jgi:GNAT superfamily N-acetyltransferase
MPNGHRLIDVSNAEHRRAYHPIRRKVLWEARGRTGVIRLVAIREDCQRQGHGRHLSRLNDAYTRDLGLRVLYLSAAPRAIGYDAKKDWHPHEWNPQELAGIAEGHLQVRKILA